MQPIAFRAGVLGAGQMGAGIAATLLRSGISTTMVDVNPEILEAGSSRARQLAAGRSKSKTGQADDADSAQIASLLTTSTSPAPLADRWSRASLEFTSAVANRDFGGNEGGKSRGSWYTLPFNRDVRSSQPV